MKIEVFFLEKNISNQKVHIKDKNFSINCGEGN